VRSKDYFGWHGVNTAEGQETIKSTKKAQGAKLGDVRRVVATHGHMGMSGRLEELQKSARRRYSSINGIRFDFLYRIDLFFQGLLGQGTSGCPHKEEGLTRRLKGGLRYVYRLNG